MKQGNMKANPQYPHNTLLFVCILAIISVVNTQQCGRTVLDKIINGQDVSRGTYPWMVGIVNAKDTSLKCGGTLITRRFVLTAQHCLKGSPRKVRLLMGTNDLTLRDSSVRFYSVEKFLHPGNGYDIGLIKTTRPVKLGSYVQPICLPPGGSDFSDVQAVVSGWGETNADYDETGDSYYPDILRAGVVHTTSTDNCNHVMARHRSPIGDDELCAGSYGDQPDHCYGDSGGPLMYFDQDSSTWQIIGVVSGAYSCDDPNDYAFYSNVTYFRDWIISKSDYEE